MISIHQRVYFSGENGVEQPFPVQLGRTEPGVWSVVSLQIGPDLPGGARQEETPSGQGEERGPWWGGV